MKGGGGLLETKHVTVPKSGTDTWTALCNQEFFLVSLSFQFFANCFRSMSLSHPDYLSGWLPSSFPASWRAGTWSLGLL